MTNGNSSQVKSFKFWQKMMLTSGICMILLAGGLGGISYWSMQRAADDIRGHGGQMLEETNRRFLASIISGQADTINHQLEQAKNSVTIGARMLVQELSSERFPHDETFEMTTAEFSRRPFIFSH